MKLLALMIVLLAHLGLAEDVQRHHHAYHRPHHHKNYQNEDDDDDYDNQGIFDVAGHAAGSEAAPIRPHCHQ